MTKIVFFTYIMLFAAYSATYHSDYQIEYPCKPFKLKKQKSFISKKMIICRDSDRGMVNITFYLQMLAHVLTILSPIALIIIYENKWYQNDGFYLTYRGSLMSLVVIVFGLPTLIAVVLHNFITKREKKNDKSNEMVNKDKRH